ncbi:MAG: choice-of-anchor J domain-containing protein [bacterium]
MSRKLHHVPLICLCLMLSLVLMPLLAGAHEDYIRNPDPRSAITPPQPARTDLLTESFEVSVPPPGWAMLDQGSGSNWFQTDFIAHSGTYCAVVAYDDPGLFQDEWLVTPLLDFTGKSAIYLEFYEDEDYWASYGLAHYVMVSTTSQTDPASFTPVMTMTPANHTVNGFGGAPVTVSLAAYANEPVVYVALRYAGDWADNWFVDDVRVYEPFEHDVAVADVTPAGQQFSGGDTLTPVVTVENVGQNVESFDVIVEISESGSVIHTEIVAMNNLAVGAVSNVTFTGLTLAAGHYYHVNATADLTTDMDLSNNVMGVYNNTYTQTRVPLGHLNTNAGCSPCAPANQALDAYMPTQGNDVALIRLHVWWPSNSDIMWLYNMPQIEVIANQYGADYAPHFWVDGVVDVGSASSSMAAALNNRKLHKSPMRLEIGWDGGFEQTTVRVTVLEPMAPGNYRLKVAITEDNINFAGGNGENVHHQAFRWMYPDVNGLAITTGLGSQDYTVDTPLDLVGTVPNNAWVFDELRVTVYVQEANSWEVLQAATAFLHENPVASFLSEFSVTANSGAVNVHWNVNASASPADFTLEASNGLATWDVPFVIDNNGRFQGRDESVHLANGGEVTYSLYYGQGRELIGSRTVELNAVDRMTCLFGASPNPFNPMTDIKFSVGQSQRVRIAVYDMSGRLVTEIANEVFGQGEHTVPWNGTDKFGRVVSSGTYFAQMQTAQGTFDTEKLMLVR